MFSGIRPASQWRQAAEVDEFCEIEAANEVLSCKHSIEPRAWCGARSITKLETRCAIEALRFFESRECAPGIAPDINLSTLFKEAGFAVGSQDWRLEASLREWMVRREATLLAAEIQTSAQPSKTARL